MNSRSNRCQSGVNISVKLCQIVDNSPLWTWSCAAKYRKVCLYFWTLCILFGTMNLLFRMNPESFWNRHQSVFGTRFQAVPRGGKFVIIFQSRGRSIPGLVVYRFVFASNLCPDFHPFRHTFGRLDVATDKFRVLLQPPCSLAINITYICVNKKLFKPMHTYLWNVAQRI